MRVSAFLLRSLSLCASVFIHHKHYVHVYVYQHLLHLLKYLMNFQAG